MKEGIAARVGRIISASVNALIDAVEGAAPTVVLEEAIREVDSAIDEVQSEIARTMAKWHVANTRLKEANERHLELSNKISLAIKKDRDDLAEAALGRQMDIEAQRPVLERGIAEAGVEQKALEGYVGALEAKKREMQEELKTFSVSREQTMGASNDAVTSETGVPRKVEKKVAKAVSAFDRLLEKQTGLPGMPSGNRKSAELAELENLARQNRIKERLAEAKAHAKG